MSDPFAAYLVEIEQLPRLSFDERASLLRLAREGDQSARKSLIESYLFDVARIAMGHPRPAWMQDADKVQEANIILFRTIEDDNVSDILSHLKKRIPRHLDEIPDRGADGGNAPR